MKQNVGKQDSMIRVLLSVAILAAGVYFKSWWGTLALVPFVTGAIMYCPIYNLLGISTCKLKKVVN